jgi:hypothetical protein
MIAVAGILFNAIGVLMLLRYGLPFPLPRLGIVLKALTSTEVREEERRHALGFIGLVAFVVGILLQLVSVTSGMR